MEARRVAAGAAPHLLDHLDAERAELRPDHAAQIDVRSRPRPVDHDVAEG